MDQCVEDAIDRLSSHFHPVTPPKPAARATQQQWELALFRLEAQQLLDTPKHQAQHLRGEEDTDAIVKVEYVDGTRSEECLVYLSSVSLGAVVMDTCYMMNICLETVTSFLSA